MLSKSAAIVLGVWLIVQLTACGFDPGQVFTPGSTTDTQPGETQDAAPEAVALDPAAVPELAPTAQNTAVPTQTAVPKPPTVVEYNLGDALITQDQYSADDPNYEMPVRLEGLLGVPPGSAAHPLVLILHGDHVACPPDSQTGAEHWPCSPEQEQLNYRGFAYLVEELAAQGYMAVAINANAAYTSAYGAADPGSRLAQIIDHHLARLVGAGQGQENQFGVNVYGRIDPKRLAWIAHSTAGELAGSIIRAHRLDDAMTAAFTGYGPVLGLLQAAPTLERPDTLPQAAIPLAVILPSCDGAVLDLAGQAYFEAVRDDPRRETPATTVLLNAANHNQFNEIVTPDMQAGLLSPHCRLEQLLHPEEQRDFLALYAADFLASLFGLPQEAAAASAVLGLDPAAAAPRELYGRQALLTVSPPGGREELLLRPFSAAELSRSLLGGEVLAQNVQLLYCPPGTNRHKAETSLAHCHRLQANHPGNPAQLLLSWEQPGASLGFRLPPQGLDLRSHAALQLRAVLDPLSPLNTPGSDLSFTLRLTDTAGGSAAVTIPAGSPALAYPAGELLTGAEGPEFSGHVQMSLLRVPLDSFAGVDLSAVSELALDFDRTEAGALFIADLGFVRPRRYPGSYSALLQNDGSLDNLRSIGRFQGTSSCTASLIDSGDPQVPAIVLTNGHCVQQWSANDVLLDVPAANMQMVFNYFANTRAVQIVVPATRILYSTMKGRDVALVELDVTLGELQNRDITPFPLAAEAPGAAAPITVIGAPAAELPSDAAYLRQEACAADGTVSILEHDWQFNDTYRLSCQDIYGGSSGSPLFEADSEEIIAIVNTTTVNGRFPCELDAPCEITNLGTYFSQDTSYATPVFGIGGCFSADGRFDITLPGCPLDDGRQLHISGAPSGPVRPTTTLAGGAEMRRTWNAALSGDLPYYRFKIGPAAATDCRVDVNYSEVRSLAEQPLISDPLPDDEGHYILCLLAGPGPEIDPDWQQPPFATSARVEIDTTPPAAAPSLIITPTEGTPTEGTPTDGDLTIRPTYDPPEIAAVSYKVGPLAGTDCADQSGYQEFTTQPLLLSGADLPALLCLTGQDAAGNSGPPQRHIIDDTP